MKRIKLTETDLTRIIQKVINEQSPIIDGPDADTSNLVERLDKLEKKVAGMDSLLKNHFLKVHPDLNRRMGRNK